MDNKYFRSQCKYIDALGKRKLKSYLRTTQRADPYSDGGDLEDICVTLLKTRATKRLDNWGKNE